MKLLMPWFCLIAAASSSVVYAADGIEAYRRGDYVQAAEDMEAQMDKDPVASYYQGLMRLYGYGQLKNDHMALRYFIQAGQKGYLPAQKLLARLYLIRAQDPEQALEWFKKAAAARDEPAQMYVAAAYLFGYGVKKNEDLARRYYIDAAKNGNPLAQYTLAINFLTSRDNSNKKMGMIWLGKAAQNGNVAAQFKLGELAKKAGDTEEAEEWFTKAAKNGSQEAQAILAQTALQEQNTEDSTSTSTSTSTSASATQPFKQPVKQPVKQATETPEIAVAKWLSNNQTDSLNQGSYRLKGIYSDWHNPLALKENNYNQPPQMPVLTRQELFQPQFVMAEPNDIPISDYLDVLASSISGNEAGNWAFPRYDFDGQIEAVLHDGFSVMQHSADEAFVDRSRPFQIDDNPVKAFDYLAEKTPGWEYQANLQAVLSELYAQAILGESSAQFELGQLYQYGVGVAKNVSQAIAYFQLAAMQQDVRAEYNLGILYLEGQTSPVNYAKGLEWMNDAAFKGNPYAQYALANIYEKGFTDPSGNVIVPPDHQQAMAMYYLASSNNFGDAEYRLADYLVKEKKTSLSVNSRQNRNKLIKRLYQAAVSEGVAEAVLPLAFYNAMDSDPHKQAHAFAVANQQAHAGNPDAALLLGMMYERGLSVPVDKANSIYWFQQAGLKNPVSAFILGTYYSEGSGLPKDVDKGRSLLQQSANAGFSYANLNLAVLQHQTAQPFLEELDRARLAGNSKAGLLLADYYLLQANDPEKVKQAGDIYQFFAGKGDKDAAMKLGFLHEHGLIGEPDNQLAARWYTESANQGQAAAQYLLGQLYQLGRLDKEPDYELAKKWYSAAVASYPKAALALGFIYDTVDSDYLNAEKNYNQAAGAGEAIGLFNAGLIHEYGKGVAVNNQKAMELYSKAADAGNTKAMTQLAGLYFRGVDGKPDKDKALYWYKKAASAGENGAMYQLGLLSETGVATATDFANAIRYYQQSSDKGNAKAKLALARIYQFGHGVAQNYPQAVDIYKQLAADNNAYAQFQLATLCLNGHVSDCQRDQAKVLLQKAIDNGNKQAQILLQRLKAGEEQHLSFVEPLNQNQLPIVAGQAAEMMFFDAINEWNRGDEVSSRQILGRIIRQFPRYAPAKRAWNQLNQQLKMESGIALM